MLLVLSDDENLLLKLDGWIVAMESDLQNSFLSNLMVVVNKRMEKAGEIKRLLSSLRAMFLPSLKIKLC